MGVEDELLGRRRQNRSPEPATPNPKSLDPGVEDELLDGGDKNLLYDWMYYGSNYATTEKTSNAGALAGYGWADFEVHRLYWGLRYLGADLQSLQEIMFPNR